MNNTVALVIPCYKVKSQIISVLDNIPDIVDQIYCIDDKCPDGSGKFIEENNSDSRVNVIYQDKNQGVGGATMTGYKYSIKYGATVIVKIDGDGQMDPSLIDRFIEPILSCEADYTKGNRFYNIEDLSGMPVTRLIGNAILSFLAKISTGYWCVFDPTNGYTAIHANILRFLPLDKIQNGYFFESDMLFRLNVLNAAVLDIPMKSVYKDEKSNINILKIIPYFSIMHLRNFFKRIFYNYYLRNFNIASIELLVGASLVLFGIFFGVTNWYSNYLDGNTTSSGTVMIVGISIIVGMQLLLSFLSYDISITPVKVMHNRIKNIS